MGLTFANYVIKPFFPDCENPDDAVRLLAAAAICTLKKLFFIKLKRVLSIFLLEILKVS
jgi:hypothetical protein